MSQLWKSIQKLSHFFLLVIFYWLVILGKRDLPREPNRDYVKYSVKNKIFIISTYIQYYFEDSSKEDWETEQKPAIQTPEATVQVKLEFVRQDGEVRVLNIREVSSVSTVL